MTTPTNTVGSGGSGTATSEEERLPVSLEDAATSADENEDTTVDQPQNRGMMTRPSGGSSTSGQISDVLSSNNQGGSPIQVVAAHPKAQLFHSILNTLGGGDKAQYSVDPQTGAMSVTRVPQTTGQLAKGIIAGALTGMFAGASEHGPGSEGRSAAAGFQAAQQQRLQQQAQQQQQAKEDFDRQQQTKVRQAQIMKANFDAMKSAYAFGKENDEQKDKIVANHADDLAQWTNTGAVKDKNVPSDELLKKGYDPSKYIAVPDGKVAVFKPDGTRATDDKGVPLSQITYSVIDGTTQAPLSQEKYDKMVKYGLQRQGTSARIPEGATISSAVLAQMNHRMDLIDQTQHEIDSQIGPGKVDVLAKIKENPEGYVRAIEALHNDGSSTQLDNQVNNLQGKNAGAAGLVRDLIGNDNLEGLKDARTNREAAQKTAAQETARVTAEEATPTGKAKAAKEVQQLANERRQGVKTDLEIQKLQRDAPTETGVHGPLQDGVDTAYLNSLPIGKQRTLQLVMAGRLPFTPQALRTSVGGNYAEMLASAFPGDETHPGFDASKAPSYEKMRQDYTSGKAFQRIQASGNALGHLQQYLQSSRDMSSTFPGVKNLAGAGVFGKAAQDKAKQMQATIEFISEETAKATKGGVPDKAEVERIRDILENWTPGAAQSSAKAVAQILKTPIDNLQTGWENGMPYGVVSPLRHLMSPEATKAYTQLTGEHPTFARTGPVEPNPPNQQAAPQSHTFSVSAWQKANPNGDANAARAAAQAQGYQVTN